MSPTSWEKYSIKKKEQCPHFALFVQSWSSNKRFDKGLAMAYIIFFGFIAVKLLVKVVGPILRLRI